MSNTVIKIKRTSVAGRAANSTTLTNPGELALNMTDRIMYSTNGSVVFEIGANNTNVNVSNTLTVKTISANGSNGTAGQVLTSNGSIAYWSAASGGGATLTANNTDTQTFYLPMANTTSGSWSNAVVSTTKLYFVPSTGTLNATIFNSLSDASLKKDVENISSALELVAQMRGVKFTWKDSETRSSGIIAQELESVTPDLVNTNNDGIKSVNYDGIIAYLIEAVKEIKDRLDKSNK